MKLWGGRFQGEADSVFADFNASFSFDKRLIEADVQGSLAYAEALAEAGILSKDELGKIENGLEGILRHALEHPSYVREAEAEDVHSFVESELVREIGEAGY